jgi:hypothetical protein
VVSMSKSMELRRVARGDRLRDTGKPPSTSYPQSTQRNGLVAKGPRTPTVGNAVRLAARRPTHSEPNADGLLPIAADEGGRACGADLTGHQMRPHFTLCPNRLARSGR